MPVLCDEIDQFVLTDIYNDLVDKQRYKTKGEKRLIKTRLNGATARKRQFIETQNKLPPELQTPISAFPVIKDFPEDRGCCAMSRFRRGRRRRSNQEYIVEMKCDRMFVGTQSETGIRSGSTFENVSFSRHVDEVSFCSISLLCWLLPHQL